MKVREVSSNFSLLVFSTNVDLGASMKVTLARAGYDVNYVDTEETFLDRLYQMTPHIAIFSLSSLSRPLSEIVDRVTQISPEIQFIFLIQDENFQILTEYADYGVLDIVPEGPPQLDNRVLWAVDRACERLYLQYQNEQIYDQLKTVEQKAAESTTVELKTDLALVGSNQQANSAPATSVFSIREFILDLRSAQSKEELLHCFLRTVSSIPLVYLKYLPSMSSFVVTHTSHSPNDNTEGLGCRLTAEENKDLVQQISLGIVAPSLSELLDKAFQIRVPRLRPLFDRDLLEGVLVFDGAFQEQIEGVDDYFAILSLAYSHFCLEKRLDAAEVIDSITELFNRKYYLKKIQDEVQRARRVRQPLSIVKLALDDFHEIESTLGEATRDLIFKNLAGLILKTSRAEDISCRTGLNEISLILPFCNRSGAEIRAERLRRIVESSSLIDNGLKMSISLGANEYPSMCSSAEKLDEGAAKALQFILGKGGNKLCFFKAPANHKPDFEVPRGIAT